MPIPTAGAAGSRPQPRLLLLLLVLTLAGSIVGQHAQTNAGLRTHRRARVGRDFAAPVADSDAAAAAAITATQPSPAAAAADSEDGSAVVAATASTVPGRELGDLLHMDTNKFSEKQKQLFKKIVERVARVSIAASEQQQQQQMLLQQANAEAATVHDDIAPAANDDAAAAADNEDDDEEETVALLPIEEGRDSKTRQTKVKYTPPVQISGKPGGKPTVNGGVATTVKVRQPAGRPTVSPDGGLDKHKYKLIVNTNINRPASSVATKTDNYTEVIFGNITTTSIVDSLQASEQQRDTVVTKNNKKRPPTTAAAMAAAESTVSAAAASDASETKVSDG